MMGLLGSIFHWTTPSPLVSRSYEAFIRGPALAVTDRFGTVDAYRLGGQYLKAITEFPQPQDAFVAEGIQESGEVTVSLAASEGDAEGVYARLLAIQSAWRNVLVDVDLVTRYTRADATTVELVNERRGTVKSLRRRGATLELSVVDVDRSAIEALFPTKLFTLADFPKLYVDHVNRAVPQVVGDARKVPLTYIDNTVGAYVFIVCEVVGTAPTLRTLYRGGRVVTASEYVVGTVVVGATTYLKVTFTREQLDFDGNLYELTADILGPGSRIASDEIQRVLLALGATTDAGSFAAASLYGAAQRMYVDCPYITQKKGTAVLQDLLQVARGQLYKSPAGSYGISIDRPRDVRAAFDDTSAEVQVSESVAPEIVKTIRLEYRPSAGQKEEFDGKLMRATSGTAGETVHKNPYVREHETADRLLCYLTKREEAQFQAHATVYGRQFAPSDVLALRSDVAWSGWRNFAAPRIERPADGNDVTLEAYDESVYVYTPGTIPGDATNTYAPDYSQTPPSAPASITISQNMTFETVYQWPAVTDVGGRPILYVVEDNASGSYVEVFRGDVTSFTRTGLPTSGTVTARVRAVVQGATTLASATVSSSPFAFGKKIDDNYIPLQGVSGISIANTSINQGRSYTGTGSASGTANGSGNGNIDFQLDLFAFCPNFYQNGFTKSYVGTRNAKAGAPDCAGFRVWNSSTTSSESYDIDWRKFNP